MAIPNKNKLAELFAELRRIEESRSKESEKNIRLLYKEMLRDLQEFLGVQYAKYAEDDALTYAALARKGRYARFLEEVQDKLDGIMPKVNKEITKVVTDMYDTAFRGMVSAVSVSVNNRELSRLLKGVSLTRPEVIKAAVTNPVARLTLSGTLAENRKQIVYNINKTITVGIMNGDRMSVMANKIKADVNENYRKSMLIARTEVHRVRETGHNDAALDIDKALKNADSEYRMIKTWRNMQDSAVRRTEKANHWLMEGKTVLMDEDFDLGNGVTAPCPGQSGTAYNDCNCRCFILHDLVNDDEFFKLTGRHFPAVNAMPVDKLEKSDIIESKAERLSKYLGQPIIETDNQHVREWYYANVSDIPNQIDKSQPFIEQVKQAFHFRNKYKHEARVAMSDIETAELLEKKRPAPTFEELVEGKIKRKGMTREEALEDILNTASKTNKDVNKEFGL